MKKEYLSRAFLCFVELFAGLWITLFISLIGIFFARFWVPFDSIEEAIFCFSVMTVVMCISLYVCAYRMGDKDRKFDIKIILIPLVMAFIIQLIYAAIFSFSIYTSGPAYYLGKIIYMLRGDTEPTVPDQIIFVCMLAFDVIYTAVYLLGEYFGVKRRSKDREQLLSDAGK